MTREITQIKVWKDQSTKEYRVYVSFSNTVAGDAGCYYLTGNKWHAKGTFENMSKEELRAAKAIGIVDGAWKTIWANEMAQRQVAAAPKAEVAQTQPEPEPAPKTNRYPGHCQACGQPLAAGEGRLVHLTDEEDIDLLGGGHKWIMFCNDTAGCEARRTEISAEKAAAAKREQERIAEEATLPAAQLRQERDGFWNNFFDAVDW